MTGVLIKKGNLGTETGTHSERECHVNMKADWGEASANEGVPKIASTPAEAGRGPQNRLSSQCS